MDLSRTSFFFCLYLVLSSLTAQDLGHSVVGSAGGYFTTAGTGSLHFTVGEIAVERTENGPVLARGFHHGIAAGGPTSTWAAPRVSLRLSAFPNPTTDRVTLAGDWDTEDRIEVRDLFGRLLQERRLPPDQVEIELAVYPAGTYFLTVTRAGQPVAGARVVRR